MIQKIRDVLGSALNALSNFSGSVFIVIGIFLFFGISLLIINFFIFPFSNSNLNDFSKRLENISLPIKTERVSETISEFGNLDKGQQCGYYSGFLIRTELSSSDIYNYYSKIEIPAANPSGKLKFVDRERGESPVKIKVSKPWEQVFASSVTELGKAQSRVKEEYSDKFDVEIDSLNSNVYVIEAYDMNYRDRYLICR